MDLSLLSHLSDAALRAEAERRGIAVEGLVRDAVIEAIRADEATLATRPPVSALEATQPFGAARAASAPTEESIGTLGALRPSRARALLGKVVGLARAAIERRPPSAPAPARVEPAEEPIRTKTMALLLLEQGHVERARAILEELATRGGDLEIDAALKEANGRRARGLVRARADALFAERRGTFVQVVAEPGVAGVVWRVEADALERGRALVGAAGVLSLRVVTVAARPGHVVESRREDRCPIESSGWALLAPEPDARLVVSVGVSREEHYASVTHTAHR